MPPVLVFDVGGVFVRHDNDLLHRRLADACTDPSRALPLLTNAVHDRIVGTGRLSVEALYDQLVADLGLKVDHAEFLHLWCCHFSEEPGMEPVIEALARRYRTVLFSNTNAPHWAHVAKHYSALSHAHALYLSHEMGMVKPDPDSFQYVLAVEACAPSDCIFIDDRFENVTAAIAIGMQGIVFTGRAALKTSLTECGITVEL